MEIKTIIMGAFERSHASVSEAKSYISRYCCYQQGTEFVIERDGEEIGFGVFFSPMTLEDGDIIYTPEWVEEPDDDMFYVGYFDEDGQWHRSLAVFKSREEAQDYCDACNFGEPAHYITVE